MKLNSKLGGHEEVEDLWSMCIGRVVAERSSVHQVLISLYRLGTEDQ